MHEWRDKEHNERAQRKRNRNGVVRPAVRRVVFQSTNSDAYHLPPISGLASQASFEEARLSCSDADIHLPSSHSPWKTVCRTLQHCPRNSGQGQDANPMYDRRFAGSAKRSLHEMSIKELRRLYKEVDHYYNLLRGLATDPVFSTDSNARRNVAAQVARANP